MGLTEEQIGKAAQWWADRVCKPVFSGLSAAERMDKRNAAYHLGEILASRLVEDVDADQRQKFVDTLSELLRDGDYKEWCGLSVDYHPDRTLALAAERAGVSVNNFPWKTHMNFRDGEVRAASGYGAPFETL